MIELRDYQQAIITDVRAHMRRGVRRILIQAPTGAGKTVLCAHMMHSSASKGLRSWFMVHRRELLAQSSRTFRGMGIPHGLIASGMSADRRHAVQVAAVQTVARRLDRVDEPAMIVWDECHHIAAASWAAIFDRFPKAFHIGLSATPERLDGTGLGTWFDEMVCGPPTGDLIERGALTPYRVFAPPGVVTDGVHQRAGDFRRDELEQAVDKPTITGDIVRHYQKLSEGRRAVLFAVSIQHSLHMVEAFREAGIPAAHVDGDTDPLMRDQCVEALRRGDIRVLSNVDLFGEGVDVPAIETVILARPTMSTGLYLQQVGRALRPAPGKDYALILDHAGNVKRHGLPDAEREWSLAGRPKRRQKDPDEVPLGAKQCPSCFAQWPTAVTKCNHCGHTFVVKAKQIAEVDGELVEIDKVAAKRAARVEQGRAQTKDDLVALATARGYKRPHAWAHHVWAARQRKNRMSGFKLSQRSLTALQGVHPDLVRIVELAITITPIDFVVTEGLRTRERQSLLVKQGKSRTMNSRHLTGHAVDVAALVDGKVSWLIDHYRPIADAFKEAAQKLGLQITWGGDWKRFVDGPHFELPRNTHPAD